MLGLFCNSKQCDCTEIRSLFFVEKRRNKTLYRSLKKLFFQNQFPHITKLQQMTLNKSRQKYGKYLNAFNSHLLQMRQNASAGRKGLNTKVTHNDATPNQSINYEPRLNLNITNL